MLLNQAKYHLVNMAMSLVTCWLCEWCIIMRSPFDYKNGFNCWSDSPRCQLVWVMESYSVKYKLKQMDGRFDTFHYHKEKMFENWRQMCYLLTL